MQMSTELWFLALGVAIPAICLIAVSTAMFFMKRKSRKKDPDMFFKTLDFNRLFGDSLQNQILSQHLDTVFDAIIANIEKERLRMKEMLNARSPVPEAPSYVQMPQEQPVSPPSRQTVEAAPVETKSVEAAPVKTPASEAPQEHPQESIVNLVQQGYSNREIARSLNRPQAEIDLFMKLKKIDRRSEKNVPQHGKFRAAV